MPRLIRNSNPKNDAIDEVIALYMCKRKIPKALLVKLTGIPTSTLSKALRDKSYLKLYQLRKIYDVLQVPDAERQGL